MMVEMFALVVLAVVVFAFVLAPIVRPEPPHDTLPAEETPDATTEEQREPVGTDGQPVRDMP